MVLIETSPNHFLPDSSQIAHSTSRDRQRDLNDYVIGWFDINGNAMQVAYTTEKRPADHDILSQLRYMNFIH